MPAKPAVQSFTSSWNKTVNWAKQSKIPYSAYYPVYQMDSQRLLTGSPMSEAERVRAIQAAAGMDYSTALPTDKPNPANVIQNAKSNAANIFTGLNPIGLAKNLFDTVTNTLEHPSSVYNAFKSEKGFTDTVLAPHSLLSLVPGVADIAQVLKVDPHLTGSKGFGVLAENPLSSLLDVMPIGRLGSHAISATSLGTKIGEQLGVDPAELAKLQPSQIAWKMLRAKPTSAMHLVTTEGTTELVPMTVGDRIAAFKNAHGVGSEQADLLQGLTVKNTEGTKAVQELAGPAVEAIGRLSKDDQRTVSKILQDDHRSIEDVLSDPSIPPRLADALEPVLKWGQKMSEIKMQAGDMAEIHTPFGIEKYNVTPGSAGEKVLRQKKITEDAQEKLNTAAQPFDKLAAQMQDADVGLNNYVQALRNQSTRIFSSIKRTVASLPDDAADRARAALPAAERWDRSVPDSTITLRNLLGLGPDDKLSLHSLNAIRDLFSPNGLIDHMYKSYEDQDWLNLAKFSGAAARKFDNKVFDKLPSQGTNDYLRQIKGLVLGINKFSIERQKALDRLTKMWDGTRRGEKMSAKSVAKNSIVALTNAAKDEHDKFLKVALQHPPDVWDNVHLQELTQQILTGEHTADLVDKTVTALRKQDGWTDSTLSDLRSDPRTIIEIAAASMKSSLENNMLPDIPYGIAKEYSDNAFTELAKLRATGQVPHYIPRLSNFDVDREQVPNYNMHIGAIKPRKEGALKSRIFDYKPSIYDLQLGILKGTKDALEGDIVTEFHNEYVAKFLHDGPDTEALIRNYKSEEIAKNALMAADGLKTDSVAAIIQRGLDEMGLVKWEPESVFGNLSLPKIGATQYISRDISNALKKNIQEFSLPAHGFFDRGTKIFRYSILGLSPRYTAHILFGGTYLVALRAHPGMFKFLGEAVHYSHTGEFSDKTLARFPHIGEAIEHSATQEGQEDIVFHYVAGQQQGNLTISEFLDKHQMAKTTLNVAKAAANINMRFTRAIVKAQRAVTYLDGAARAEKEGAFYDTVYDVRKDAQGKPILNRSTGKPLHDARRIKVAMTSREAHVEGMHAVASVMGDLRHMTPLERSVLTRAFPFYGWTKHILTYVMSYPFDHPFRAAILSQLATQNSADVASGLPTRIQLLFFLGKPDSQGNVSAVDTRFLDPLRDVANYASWTGLFQSLNPMITAPIAAVDPNITFGGNPLYPNLTYDSLYGTKESGPQGNPLNAAEQFVPQLTALDAAFNISGQYSYLKQNNPNAFAKKLFESLNIPFAQEQHINLRQISAKDEVSRYQQASAAARTALDTGDFSQLDQYPGTVPDPMGTAYNVTPAYLKALYDQTEKQYGLPPTEALAPLPTPAL